MYLAFLVDTFLNAVYLYDDDRLVLVLNYTGEQSRITLKLVENALKEDFIGSAFAPLCAPKEKKEPMFSKHRFLFMLNYALNVRPATKAYT